MSKVTRFVPIEVSFNDCFCAEDCQFFHDGCYYNLLADKQLLGNPTFDMLDAPIVNYDSKDGSEMWIRTPDCCAQFGFGDDERYRDLHLDDSDDPFIGRETVRYEDAEAWRSFF